MGWSVVSWNAVSLCGTRSNSAAAVMADAAADGSTASTVAEILTSITRHRSGTSEGSGSRPLVPEPDRPVLLRRSSQQRRGPPTEESQVVLGEGAVSF